MGLSSVLIVLNSLRLSRLDVAPACPASAAAVGPTPRRWGVVLSVLLPVVLFAGLTVVSQVVSPARGQALLPELPSLFVTNPPARRWVGRDLLRPRGGRGDQKWHLIFTGTAAQLATVHPLVVAGPGGGPLQTLRQLKVSPGHFTDFVVLPPRNLALRGHDAQFGSWMVSFSQRHTVG